MFGRATIRLGIGPHSSCIMFHKREPRDQRTAVPPVLSCPLRKVPANFKGSNCLRFSAVLQLILPIFDGDTRASLYGAPVCSRCFWLSVCLPEKAVGTAAVRTRRHSVDRIRYATLKLAVCKGVYTNRLPLVDGTNFIFPVRKLYRLWSVTWMQWWNFNIQKFLQNMYIYWAYYTKQTQLIN